MLAVAGLPAGAAARDSEKTPGSTDTCVVTADAAEHWLSSGTRLPCNPQRKGYDEHAYTTGSCVGTPTTADTAEYWIRHAGRLPGCPG